ncbi:MAG: PilZ domain-containing protein, partial [Candidatus Omnitrophica bacterium]|nr:PilZ domain-containing protein [Candidatus Omnitrophota bacterium]
MDNEERRKFGRVKMTFPVEFGSSDSLKGETFDLSGSGLRVITKFSLTCFQKMKIYLNLPPCFSADPEKAIGIKANGCAVWSKKMKNQKYMSGVNFLEIVPEDFEMLQKIIHSDKMTSKISTKKPEFKISREIHSCNMYAIDLTVGCEHKCLYCHFSTIKKNEWQKENFCATEVIPVDLAPLYRLKQMPDSVVYLSPSSDAFAPLARDLTHELLSYMLPKGVIFTISTKAIIPQKTIKLLKKYKHLIEGIAVGITNLDKDRNALLEPGVPPAN